MGFTRADLDAMTNAEWRHQEGIYGRALWRMKVALAYAAEPEPQLPPTDYREAVVTEVEQRRAEPVVTVGEWYEEDHWREAWEGIHGEELRAGM